MIPPKKTFIHLPLVVIIFLGIFFRLYHLADNPHGFFCDEASVGYNAYSILKTGKDEWGNRLPMFFPAFGEYKNPVMTYSAIPFIGVFGLSEFSVRLTSVFYGVITILILYLFLAENFNPQIALFSSLFLAISPWHVHFSRTALEGLTPFVFFTVCGHLFWFRLLKNHSIKNLFFSVLFFALALYSYFPARIFIPLYCFCLFLFTFKKIFQPKLIILLFSLTFLFILPLGQHLLSGSGFSRWQQIKGDLKISSAIQKYSYYFSPNYLFLKGDTDFPGQFVTRHSLRQIGELHLIQLPLILLGLFYLIKTKSKHTSWIITWLLLYPLSDLFTNSIGPQATRTIIGVIPFQLLTGLGLYSFFHHFSSPITVTAFFVVLGISTLYFFQKLSLYPQYSSDYWGWQSGPREVVKYFLSQKDNYDQLCLEGKFNSPKIFIKFYDPTNQCSDKCQICDSTSFDSQSKQLFALSQESYDKLNNQGKNITIHHLITYPNGQPAFVIGEITLL
ncbi:hypothetical protein A3K55_02070 [Candidatus Shapirobacteria bacterium RBG_13_44_7]|uniref:Glycosyltransferase RgtA/B/C/D-like domain-containing protein n=1 Tax=Candidatus Shapirobacteria bacterium RBG_13_44_7 TaxID=1802149 RepID=A0A1F7SJ59_9BACT|nr:MAG: hypothetical protein A3K55_02070 [Candidatus Shapirobacteria bacterium RBG_13_44_7]